MIDVVTLAAGFVSALLVPEGDLQLVRGVRSAGHIYVGGTWSQTAQRPMSSGGQYYALLSAACGPAADRDVYYLPFLSSIVVETPFRVPLRWQISGGRYYVIEYLSYPHRSPSKGDLSLLNIRPRLRSCGLSAIDVWSPRASELAEHDRLARLKAYFATHRLFGELEWMFPPPATSVRQSGRGLTVALNYDVTPSKAPFHPADFLVVDENTVEEYVVRPNRVLSCYRRVAVDPDSSKSELTESWTTEGLTSFRVVSSKGARYLIGHFDQVYKLEKGNGPSPGVIRQLRRATFPPALATPSVLISDAEHGKHYLFMAHRYFEIADPIVERPHRVSISGKLGTPSENLSVVQDCFRAVGEVVSRR